MMHIAVSFTRQQIGRECLVLVRVVVKSRLYHYRITIPKQYPTASRNNWAKTTTKRFTKKDIYLNNLLDALALTINFLLWTGVCLFVTLLGHIYYRYYFFF